MKLTYVYVAVISAAAISTSAYAQAPEMGGHPTADGPTFTGFRVEFLGGYNRILPSRRTTGPSSTTSLTPKHTGGDAGVQAGYDIQAGPFVIGAFGGYALQTSNACGTLAGLNTGCLRPERQIEGGGRAGIQFGNRFLVFAKGSYVNTSIRTTVLSGVSYQNSYVNLDGWRVGGGAELAINRHVYIKAEYDYGRTERMDAAPYGFQNTNVSFHTHSVLGGVGFRF